MNRLVSLLLAVSLATASGFAFGSGAGDLRLEPAPVNRLDAESLQRGARTFVNYCLNCHSARFMRYERLQDLGLTKEQIQGNLMFATDKIGSVMTVAMTYDQARNWFGAIPPDLSVEARVRGRDWLYNYFLSFYRDEKAPSGWNNLVFPNVGMPHVAWQLSGQQRLVTTEFEDHEAALAGFVATNGLAKLVPGRNGKWAVDNVVPDPDAPGTLTPVQYQAWVADLVNYLDYMAEPAKNKRISLGLGVLLYLGVLFAFAYALKRAFWKDIH
jgi:ubiquinol-cytochrome c reductase cytochrome c1 subunit